MVEMAWERLWECAGTWAGAWEQKNRIVLLLRFELDDSLSAPIFCEDECAAFTYRRTLSLLLIGSQ